MKQGMKKGENMVMARMGRTAKVKGGKGDSRGKTEKGCGSDNGNLYEQKQLHEHLRTSQKAGRGQRRFGTDETVGKQLLNKGLK
jgi:hypothetical protein